jgi:phospholipase/carboxylesterase
MPVFFGFDPQDPIIPGAMLEQTSAWLTGPSGARLTERRYEGIGHDLTDEMRADVVAFLVAALG